MNDNSPDSVEDQMLELTKKWLNSVNETAKIARTSLLFFLVVALYLLIIVGTTTDLMLLRGEIVALPLMEVGVPVVVFYTVAPLIFLLLHSNLLLRLSQLAKTIKQWQANSKGLENERSSLVFPVDFAQLLLYGEPRWALYAVVVTQIYILPIVVLLALQMSFLAYQDSGITVWHQLLITADLVLLFLFVCFVRGTREGTKVECSYVLKMLFRMWGTVLSAGLVLILAWTIAVVPNSWQETMGIFVAILVGLFFLLRPYVSKRLRNKQDNELNKFFLPTKFIVLYGFILLSFFGIVTIVVDGLQEHKAVKWSERTKLGIVAIDVDSLQERSIQQQLSACLRQLSACVFADWWKEYPITSYRPVRRFLNVAEQPIALKEIPPEIVSALIIKEEEKEEAKPDPLCKYIGELDLSRRQLNYALFYGSQFRCVKLESAGLHGADLRRAELHGADLFGAELHGADLRWTELHGANLSQAKLHGADLRWTELHDADLSDAELHGANLFLAELHGADLSKTKFKTKLHGADLWGAKLHGADLRWTELHGANLIGAELHGADLRSAELHGANLSNAKLHGADLQWAELHGAKLFETELYGADLRGAELYGADLGDVILKNVNLYSVRWDKPEDDWNNIINNILNGNKIQIINIRDISKKRGLADDEINKRVSKIQESSSRISSAVSGFIPPTLPIATDCVFYSKKDLFTKGLESKKGCNIKLTSSLADLACRNQWTAKSIVERAIYESDINLIKALLNKNCPVLKPHRKTLNNRREALNNKREALINALKE